MAMQHVDYPHEPGQLLEGCLPCEILRDRKEVPKMRRAVAKHLKTCSECQPMGSDPQFCAVIQPTVTILEDTETALEALLNEDSGR